MTWQFTLSGFLIGALVGMTGMGGGSLLTPILVIFFGFKPTLAVGTDILHGAIFKSFGAGRHRKLGTVHGHLVLWMFLGSGPMSLLGVAVATWLSHHYGGAESIEAPFLLTRRDKLIAVAIGATCGFVVGLTSVGSGTFFGLIMLLVFPLTVAKIVGTDIFHAALLLWVAGFGHLVAGNVDVRTMAWLLTGSIPGVLLSSQFTLRIPDNVLRLGLAAVLMLSGIKLIDFAGADYVIAAGAIAAGLGFAIWGFVARLGRRPRPETVT
jgi:uncharacterized membrane protein YfcA